MVIIEKAIPKPKGKKTTLKALCVVSLCYFNPWGSLKLPKTRVRINIYFNLTGPGVKTHFCEVTSNYTKSIIERTVFYFNIRAKKLLCNFNTFSAGLMVFFFTPVCVEAWLSKDNSSV